ncbi:helix-turn-helix transcriptional regulator [Paenibacillus sp. Marseille-Q4541]|uniref:helix-turn-helix domain-containing protein n=1 Tax=Paenibacillus sp. Marseille-Q4541 TaxID=2831522 RepID=UPI001BA7B32F|nr:helix-turn-helix transcriptional regulator [Paenibacillus sp. Marseille-Q4541]
MSIEVDIKVVVAANIKALRRTKNLSQVELGEMLSLGKTTVSQWESGQKLPSAKSINKLIKLFNLKSESLFKSDEINQES